MLLFPYRGSVPAHHTPMRTRITRSLAATAFAVAMLVATALPAFTARAQNSEGSVNVQSTGTAAATSASSDTNPLSEAAKSAEEVAKSAGLRYALGNAWNVVWQKSWPFLKSMVVNFFGLFGQAWKSATTPSADVNASVNGAVNASAATNASE